MTTPIELTSQQRIDLIESVKRCTDHPSFLDRFYERFLSADPAIAGFFANTDFTKQRRMLSHSLILMMRSGVQGERMADTQQALAMQHGPAGLAIPATLYSAWLDALVGAAEQTDPLFTEALRETWRVFFERQVAMFVEAAEMSADTGTDCRNP